MAIAQSCKHPRAMDGCIADAIWVRAEGINTVIRIQAHIEVRIWFQSGAPNTWKGKTSANSPAGQGAASQVSHRLSDQPVPLVNRKIWS